MGTHELRTAFDQPYTEPTLGVLETRFDHALEASGGCANLALAVVNEMLDVPVSYEHFLALLGRDA